MSPEEKLLHDIFGITPKEQAELLALDLEYRLTIASRIGCECVPYFVARREVLIPQVLKQARERNEDPVDVFAAFARGVHQRHEQATP